LAFEVPSLRPPALKEVGEGAGEVLGAFNSDWRGRKTTPVSAHKPHKIGVITLGTFTTTTRGLVPCRKKRFPKVSREEQPLKIVPEAALVPKNYFFIKLEPGFESSDAFLIPPGEPYSTL